MPSNPTNSRDSRLGRESEQGDLVQEGKVSGGASGRRCKDCKWPGGVGSAPATGGVAAGTVTRSSRAKAAQSRWVFEGLVKHRREASGRSEWRDREGVVMNARVHGNRSVLGNRSVPVNRQCLATRFARAKGVQSTSFLEELVEGGCKDDREGEWRGGKGLVMNARVNGNRSVHGNRRGNSSGKRHDDGRRSPKGAPMDRNRG